MSIAAHEAAPTGLRKYINATTIGCAVLFVAVAASFAQMLYAERQASPAGKKVIRISHWQLEAGYRDSLDWAIAEYAKVRPDVHIEQMGITERVYGQWLNCQLIANAAPDLAEMGGTKLVTDDSYTLRYFQPMGEIVSSHPNPYNAGTILEGVPWKETFIDGMRGAYRPQLLEYYSVPTTMYTTRIYANLDLLKEATGSDELPKTFGEYLKACEQLKSLGERTGRKIIPAASCYRMDDWMVLAKYRTGFTSSMEADLDTDLDGVITPLETYAGFLRGKFSFETPSLVAYYESMVAMAETLGRGFPAIDRQQAQFMFNQGQSAFLVTGSWDAAGMKRTFDKRGWRLAVFDNPMPGPGEKWGEYFTGASNEAGVGGGGNYGVYKLSKNKDIAIDFLQFLTSLKINEEFNAKALWLPITIGADVPELMKPFMPRTTGYTAKIDLKIGSEVASALTGAETKLFNKEMSYDEMAKTVEAKIRNPNVGGDFAASIEYDRAKTESRSQERVLGMMSAMAMLRPQADTAEDQLKYRKALMQHVRKNNAQEIHWRFETLRNKPIPPM